MVETYEDLKTLSQRMAIPVKQHHVIVHSDGRVYFRVSVGLPTDRKYYVQTITRTKSGKSCLTCVPVPEGRKVKRRLLPSRKGTTGLNFFDYKFAGMVVPEGKENVRLRIIRRLKAGTDFRIWLAASPVRDLCSIWHDMMEERVGDAYFDNKNIPL